MISPLVPLEQLLQQEEFSGGQYKMFISRGPLQKTKGCKCLMKLQSQKYSKTCYIGFVTVNDLVIYPDNFIKLKLPFSEE